MLEILLSTKVAQCAINLTSVLNRKNGFAQRAKLAQKLRWRKATESNFCDKVFIGFENHVIRYIYRFYKSIKFRFIAFQKICLYKKFLLLIFSSGAKPRKTASLLRPKIQRFNFSASLTC